MAQIAGSRFARCMGYICRPYAQRAIAVIRTVADIFEICEAIARRRRGAIRPDPGSRLARRRVECRELILPRRAYGQTASTGTGLPAIFAPDAYESAFLRDQLHRVADYRQATYSQAMKLRTQLLPVWLFLT